MAITHVLLVEFKPLVPVDEIKGACEGFTALKHRCVHPETNNPYISGSVGGINNSPEGKSNGFTHVFICEFDSEEDRTYYLEKDPAHRTFSSLLNGISARVQVVDFTPGVFS